MSPATADRLTPLEVASGLVFGVEATPPDRPRDPRLDPVATLEVAILRALERPPCLVSFSGGRDSSIVLALATRLARREGLALPVPATNRFKGASLAEEDEWQELVVQHLDLPEWSRHEAGHELDCVGPVALEVLRRHGLLWPFNAHFHVPLLRAAAGGSLLTGVGGDEILGESRWARVWTVATLRARPQPRDALRLALLLAPRALRARVLQARLDVRFPWLRQAAERDVLAAWAREAAGEPGRWSRRFAWWLSLRYLRVALRSLELLAADDDVLLVHPLAERELAASLAGLPRAERFATRHQANRLVAGDLLPAGVLRRVSKASFDEVFFNRHSRRFVAEWDGEGVNPMLVDSKALRRMWSSGAPDPRSFTLLQSLKLGREPSAADRGEQQVRRLG